MSPVEGVQCQVKPSPPPTQHVNTVRNHTKEDATIAVRLPIGAKAVPLFVPEGDSGMRNLGA